VINRGNNRAEVFHNLEDYNAFVSTIADACERVPMRVLAYCVMPNHFHLVVWTLRDGDLSRWMQWLLTAQVRRYRRQYGGSGHVWQGRFKGFPIESDEHLLGVLRYVERNPVRAELAEHAEDWDWSSLGYWARRPTLLQPHPGPIDRGRNWVKRVNTPLSAPDLQRIRNCVVRGTPLGSTTWVETMASRLGLESTLRPRGRPRIAVNQ
jgi:putative transposase